ncbi:MAG: type IV pilin protein [Litorivicinus sp.]
MKRGFSLIELIIAVAIMGILAIIAVPSYQDYVNDQIEGLAQQSLLELAAVQEQYFADARGYACTQAEAGYALPSDVTDHYDALVITTNRSPLATPPAGCVVASSSAVPTFSLSLEPTSGGRLEDRTTLNFTPQSGPNW